MMREFKDFAMRGNVLDLAIGVIIGTAFGKIVTSLVNDVVMPTFGILLGKLNFSTLAITIGESKIMYGSFIQSIIDFLIISFFIFLVVKQVNRFKKTPPAASAPNEEVKLLTEIRDLLKK